MKKKLSAIILGIGLLVGGYFVKSEPLNEARLGGSELWKFTSSLLQPVVSTWNVYAPADFRFDGDLLPDGSDCANGEILKKTGADNWDCAADAGGSISSNSLNFDEFQNPLVLDANITTTSGSFTWDFGGTNFLGIGQASISRNITFNGELKPDGALCSNGQILKKTGANDWDCAADTGGSVSSNSIDWDEIVNSMTLDANTSIASGAFTFSFGTTDVTINLARLGVPTSSSLQSFANFALSPGRSIGGTLTTASNDATRASVSAGEGFIKATDNDTAQVLFFTWPASNAFVIPTDTVRYLGVLYGGGVPRVTAKTSDTWNLDTEFPLGAAINEGGTVSVVNIPWITADNIANIIERFDSEFNFDRDERVGGLIVSNTGTRNVAVSAGTILGRMSEFSFAAFDTSSAGSFRNYYRDGAGGWTAEAAQTTWNNSSYDDGDGGLATLTALAYTSRWIYIMTDGTVAILYGQSQDLDLSDIIAESPPSSVPNKIKEMGILAGRFIIRASGTTPAVTQSAFGTPFTAATVTAHNSLSGLAWTSTGHTGTALTFAGFDSGGAATEYTEANYIINSGRSGSQRITGVGSNKWFGIGATPQTMFEVQGTSSGSFGLFNGGLQVSGFASAAYSRFGSGTTGHALNAADDLLITGDTEIDSQLFLDSSGSVSLNFEISGYASASKWFGGNTASAQWTFDLSGTDLLLGLNSNQFIFKNDVSVSQDFDVLGTGSSSFAGSLDVTKGVHAAGNVTSTLQFVSYGTASNSFSGSLNLAKGLHGVGNVTTSAQFLSTGAASNSFSGSLNLSKGLTANSYQGGGLSLCTAAQKLRWSAGQFSCTTDDDVPESGDFGAITGGTGITFSDPDISVNTTELEGLTWGAGGNATNVWTFNLSAGDPTLTWTQSGASLSLNFEAKGYASSSFFKGTAFSAVPAEECNDAGDTLNWANGSFTCGTDASAAGSGVASNSLDWDEFVNAMTLDATTTISSSSSKFGLSWGGTNFYDVGTIIANHGSIFEKQIQVGGTASVAYSRFGTATTTHTGTIIDADDLLISGGLEINGSTAFDGFVSFAVGASFSDGVSGHIDTLSRFGATAAIQPSTSFATFDTRNDHPVLDFDDTASEAALFEDVMSRDYDDGTVTVYITSTATSATTGAVNWCVQFDRIDETQDIDGSTWATQQCTGNDTVSGTSGIPSVATITLTQAQMDGVRKGELYRLRVKTQTITAVGDIELISVMIAQ